MARGICAGDEILRAVSQNEEGGAAYLLLSPRRIAAEELQNTFADKSSQEFASITEGLEAKYGCKDQMLCYVVCYFCAERQRGDAGGLWRLNLTRGG